MATAYFSHKGHQVRVLEGRFEAPRHEDFVQELLRLRPQVVLNAIGRVKQKTDDLADLLWANAILPLELANRLPPDAKLIQPSTDCVFDGTAGRPYGPAAQPDARDPYGWSKRLGEVALENRPNALVVRVSIIGPDNSPGAKGLLAWFLRQPPGATLQGFTNHHWNGITTLEWCKRVEELLRLQSLPDFVQLGTPEHHTKAEMLRLFQRKFRTRFDILDHPTAEAVDRRLVPQTPSPSLDQQLDELLEFMPIFNAHNP